jgi:hypothetical protein
MFDQNLIVGLVVLAVVVLAVYAYAPKLRGMLSGFGIEGFKSHSKFANMAGPSSMPTPGQNGGMGGSAMPDVRPAALANPNVAESSGGAIAEGMADFASDNTMGPVPMAAGAKPQGCYPREQLNPMDLLPEDVNSQWAQVNPTGAGDIQGKNFLSAGALIGVNTIGQSLRNANYQLRSEPANPQVQVGPWQQSTIEPDLNRRPLE